ncbi:MAG: dCTP deaminase, partial [Bdellovibrionales bacterium]
MILSDKTLRQLIQSGELGVDPLNGESIQPASIDCRLGDHFLVVEDRQMHTIDLNSEIIYRQIHGTEITIPPHSFLLATTMEYVRLPRDLTAFVEGRSSIGRIGVFIHNAGGVDPGCVGLISLEL